MSTTTMPNRHPEGTKVAGKKAGGQFAPGIHTEPDGGALAASLPHPLARPFEKLEDKISAMSEEVGHLVAQLRTDTGWQNYLSAMSKFHRYSMANQLLISIQLPHATRVAGKTAWKRLGREVLPYAERGNGASIFRPIVGWVDKVDEHGEKILGLDGKPLRIRRPVGYSATTVYDISQTAGDELPTPAPRLTEEPPEGFIPDLESAITAQGYTVSYGTTPPGVDGYTSPRGEVVVDQSLPPGERAYVLSHELGHIAAGHLEGDTSNYHVGPGGQRGRMEIEAESIAHVLLRMNGMDPSRQTSAYAAGWARVQTDDPNVVQNSATVVQKAVIQLIGDRQWTNVEDSGPQERPTRTPRRKKP